MSAILPAKLDVRIFVSYASERRSIAERLAMALRSEGHDVFFAPSSLPDGQTYDAKIRAEIARRSLFAFLISPESVAPNSYALSELEIMARRAPAAGDRVLPVMVAPVAIDLVPNYLRTLTILEPIGDLTADVTAKIHDIASARHKTLRRRLVALALMVGALVAFVGAFLRWHENKKKTHPPGSVVIPRNLSVFEGPDQNSQIIGHVSAGEGVSLFPSAANPNWLQIHSAHDQGWVMAQDLVVGPGDRMAIKLGQGYGFQGGFWKLFFTSPQPEGKPPNKFGIDARFADAIGRAQKSLDIAAYELNSRLITDAIIGVHARGIPVRVVADDMTQQRPRQTVRDLRQAGIPVISRRRGGGMMHNKFAIIDGETVWTGSWSYTDSSTYSNNDNAIALKGTDIAARYQGVFTQLFEGRFGKARVGLGSEAIPTPLSHGLIVMFSPEDPILPELLRRIKAARKSISFLAFVFTLPELAEAFEAAAAKGVTVRGIVEKTIATTGASAVPSLCRQGSEVALRVDGNPRYLHHEVIVVDDRAVITGSVTFSRSGLTRNDGNIVIVPDTLLANKYTAEFSRLWSMATPLDPEQCAAE